MSLYTDIYMKKCILLDANNEQLTYSCKESKIPYQLLVSHKFAEVGLNTQPLIYYLTINGDKMDNENDINLLSTSKICDDIYTSLYSITINQNLFQHKLDEVKIIIVLPFDHKTSILGIELFNF
jgi:hypothetical protein